MKQIQIRITARTMYDVFTQMAAIKLLVACGEISGQKEAFNGVGYSFEVQGLEEPRLKEVRRA